MNTHCIQLKENDKVQSMKFDEFFKELNQLMIKEYVAVNSKSNPVAKALEETSPAQLTYIIQQYCIFPKEIVSFLQAAKRKALEVGWSEIALEIQRNISEELGSDTNGVSHYAILVKGLQEGLNVPIKNTKMSTATLKFVESMRAIFSREASYNLGAAYALECTAVPELEIVASVVDLLFEGAMPNDLKYFFDMHLGKWEPGHEEGLRTTAAKYLEVNKFREFAAGFRAVMETMDAWWHGLNSEAVIYEKTETIIAPKLAVIK